MPEAQPQEVRPEIYISTDIETNGPIPGINSMLSLGSAAFTAAGELIGTWSRNLLPLPDATEDEDTLKFWEQFPEAFAKTKTDQIAPEAAMREYCEWLETLPGSLAFVGSAGFDFGWMHWYLIRFMGYSPFGHSAIDAKTYAMALLQRKFRQCGKSAWPRHWFHPQHSLHTHVALEDALEQGYQFCAMLAETREKIPSRGKKRSQAAAAEAQNAS